MIEDLELRGVLLKLAQTDQEIRQEFIDKGTDHVDRELQRRMDAIDAANTKQALSVVDRYSWPRLRLVGPDGADAA